MKDKSQVILFDIRQTVYHELGHYYMARSLDVAAYVNDFTLYIGEVDYIENSTVTGSTKIFGNPDSDKIKLIGLSGEVVCSMLAHLDCEDESDFKYFDEREVMDKIKAMIYDHTISGTDLSTIKGFTFDDVTYVVDVLKKEWNRISEHAEGLISDLRKQAGV